MTTKKSSHPFWKIFWLLFLVCSLGYAWYSFYVPKNKADWVTDFNSAKQLAESSDKDLLLFFTGEWCVPCRIMKREIFADETVMDAITAKAVPVMIDIDDPKFEEVVNKYDVRGTPVTLFTDSQGEVIDYAVGKMKKEEFINLLESIDSTKEKR